MSEGSSPLTRGKRLLIGVQEQLGGLIPAHAGKTSSSTSSACPARAHPRSRGENFSRPKVTPLLPGSSPLTRGKRFGVAARDGVQGLIPAHAGKTPRGTGR